MSDPVAVSRSAVIRELDRRWMTDVGVPAAVLVEHAGHGVADAVRARFPAARRVRVLCGPGNNGADGYALARHLHIAGLAVGVEPLAPPRSPEAQVHATVARHLGLVHPIDDPDLVIDAVFGTGQRAPLNLDASFVARASGAALVAVDVPTGIDADTGQRVGAFPEPDFAVTLGRWKPWCFILPTPCVLIDLGLDGVATEPPEAVVVERVASRPIRVDADKWARGHVGLVAGTAALAGAAILAALGALRGGAGLVTLFVPDDAWPRLGQLPPEVMVQGQEALDGPAGARCDALVVGPGLGRAHDELVRRIWKTDVRPCVFDADGLRAVVRAGPSDHVRIVTPHSGEAGALLGEDWTAILADRLAAAERLRAWGVPVLKGACPIVASRPLQILRGFVPQLGTGGSGDVLAGALGAGLARAVREGVVDTAAAERVALEGVWRHLRAAESAGPPGVTASEIADALARV